MKVLIVTAGFFPGKNYGGPPVSINNLCDLLSSEDVSFYVVTRNHDLNNPKPYENVQRGWNDRDNCKVLYLGDNNFNYKSFLRVANEVKPDLMYLQSLFQSCVLPCLSVARKIGIPVLLAPRGELCEGAFRQKRYKKLPYIAVLRLSGLLQGVFFHSTSDEETEAIVRMLNADSSRVYMLANIPSIPRGELSHTTKEPGSARFVFISRIVRKKNLCFALECLRFLKGDIQMDIYGPIEDVRYWEECQEAIKVLPSNVRVSYCGLVEHDEIHKAFACYDAFVFPTLSENYGHVIAEALAAECPVVISDQTPWNVVSRVGAGWAVPLRDVEKYIDALQQIVNASREKHMGMRKAATRLFYERSQFDSLREGYVNAFGRATGHL